MKISKRLKINSLVIANLILKELINYKIFTKIEILKPGFVNFYFKKIYTIFEL